MPTADENLDHTPLTFGKYKGKTPSEVSQFVDHFTGERVGADYIRWMYEKVKNKPTCSELLARECGWRDDIPF